MTKSLLFILVSISVFTRLTHADIVVLSSGERLYLTILEQTDTSIQVHHEILGDFSIETSNITSIEATPVPSVPNLTKVEIDESDIELEEESRWNQNVRLGFGYQEGQKTSADLSISYHADQTVDEHKITLDSTYRFSESERERTANRFTSVWGNKWYQSNSRWDIFTNIQYDWAEFQSWDQRLLGDLGIEFEIYKQTKGDSSFVLSARLGSGFRKEFHSMDTDVIPEGLLGLTIDWSISTLQKFTADTTWYPDYEDASNYRLVTNAAWNIKLDMKNDLSFSIGVHHEYDSVVDAGIKNDDFQLTAGITYAF